MLLQGVKDLGSLRVPVKHFKGGLRELVSPGAFMGSQSIYKDSAHLPWAVHRTLFDNDGTNFDKPDKDGTLEISAVVVYSTEDTHPFGLDCAKDGKEWFFWLESRM